MKTTDPIQYQETQQLDTNQRNQAVEEFIRENSDLGNLDNVSADVLFSRSEEVARRAAIRWGINQTGGIPTPIIHKKKPLQRIFGFLTKR